MSLLHMKKRYLSETSYVESGGDISTHHKHYETIYPPSPTMSVSSGSYEELQDIDSSWQLQQHISGYYKKSSRTSSPQGHPLATIIVSGFSYNLFYGVSSF